MEKAWLGLGLLCLGVIVAFLVAASWVIGAVGVATSSAWFPIIVAVVLAFVAFVAGARFSNSLISKSGTRYAFAIGTGIGGYLGGLAAMLVPGVAGLLLCAVTVPVVGTIASVILWFLITSLFDIFAD